MKHTYSAWVLALLLGVASVHADVIATVNGDKITSEVVDQALMEATQGRFSSLPAEKQSELRQRMLEGMITERLIYADAKSTGVMESKEYKQAYQEITERIKIQLAAKVWEQKQLQAISISDPEVRAYYDQNPTQFVDKAQVHAHHILVATKAEAESIIASLKGLSGDALKSKFIDLAKAKSTEPNAATSGGDLGFFSQGQMVPAFNDAVFGMNVGTISQAPIQTQFGYHVIYLDEKKTERTLSFDEVKKFIAQRLQMEKFKAATDAKLKTLRQKAKIVYTNR